MPYEIRRDGGKHCVVNEETGETVKCHNTRDAAADHMQALYAAEGDEISKQEIIEKYYPMYDITSFEELEAIQETTEKQNQIYDLLNKFSFLAQNVVDAETQLYDKVDKLEFLWQELKKRVAEPLEKAAEKKESDGMHPSSHYLVVEDSTKPSTWHLRVKNVSGEPDHTLMGAAWAALHGGYRGNKYQGPDKQKAIGKLKGLYNKEGMKLPTEKSADADLIEWNVNLVVKGDGEKHLVYGIVLSPDVADSQGDIVTADEIEKAAHDFFINSRIIDYQHTEKMDVSRAVPVESYVAPVDMEVGGKVIKKGSWVMVTYVPDKDVWDEIKKGKLLSYSITGYGTRKSVA